MDKTLLINLVEQIKEGDYFLASSAMKVLRPLAKDITPYAINNVFEKYGKDFKKYNHALNIAVKSWENTQLDRHQYMPTPNTFKSN